MRRFPDGKSLASVTSESLSSVTEHHDFLHTLDVKALSQNNNGCAVAKYSSNYSFWYTYVRVVWPYAAFEVMLNHQPLLKSEYKCLLFDHRQP